jgi:hypothetical protein
LILLALDLPQGGGAAFDWLLGRMRSGAPAFANDIVTLRPGGGSDFALSLDGRALTSIALRHAQGGNAVEVAPGVRIEPQADLTGFLARQWQAFDHLGINLSHRDIGEPEWGRLIRIVSAAFPAWRLEIGSVNDIVMLVAANGERASVVELVYDRKADQTSFHVCARVAADRAAVETAFPTPFGAYKPGDEPFFRSVALPYAQGLPSYIDLAFSDAQMAPWPQIVSAIGKRLA